MNMTPPTDSDESPSARAALREALLAFEADVEHRFVFNAGTRIHYAATGKGPLLVFIHGFPDHWLGWWRQMADLRSHCRVVAIDLRGYNLSDKPEPLDAYAMKHLISDIPQPASVRPEPVEGCVQYCAGFDRLSPNGVRGRLSHVTNQ